MTATMEAAGSDYARPRADPSTGILLATPGVHGSLYTVCVRYPHGAYHHLIEAACWDTAYGAAAAQFDGRPIEVRRWQTSLRLP